MGTFATHDQVIYNIKILVNIDAFKTINKFFLISLYESNGFL